MKTLTLDIDGFDYNARGVARCDGKTTFVGGALPGERVVARITADKKRFLEAETVQILTPSPDRIVPACTHYDDCGGCALHRQNRADARPARHQRRALALPLACPPRLGRCPPGAWLPRSRLGARGQY